MKASSSIHQTCLVLRFMNSIDQATKGDYLRLHYFTVAFAKPWKDSQFRRNNMVCGAPFLVPLSMPSSELQKRLYRIRSMGQWYTQHHMFAHLPVVAIFENHRSRPDSILNFEVGEDTSGCSYFRTKYGWKYQPHLHRRHDSSNNVSEDIGEQWAMIRKASNDENFLRMWEEDYDDLELLD